MIIPTQQTFNCSDDAEATLDVDVSQVELVYLDSRDYDGERVFIHMRDREQVTMLRDMLTVWLSRS